MGREIREHIIGCCRERAQEDAKEGKMMSGCSICNLFVTHKSGNSSSPKKFMNKCRCIGLEGVPDDYSGLLARYFNSKMHDEYGDNFDELSVESVIEGIYDN